MSSKERSGKAVAIDIVAKLLSSNFLTQEFKEKLLAKLPENLLENSIQLNKNNKK